jgi:hypothetical protein
MGLDKNSFIDYIINMKKILYLFDGGFSKITDFERLPDNYISIQGNEPTPIEDIGDYLITERDCSTAEAFELFCDLLYNKA